MSINLLIRIMHLRIKQALQCLKQTNTYYKDTVFNEAWLNEFCQEHEAEVLEATDTVDSADADAVVDR